MAAARCFGVSFLYASLVSRLAVGAVIRANKCPLANCQDSGNEDVSLLELSSKRSSARAQMKCGMKFTPAHFTCSSCDKQTCQGCNNVVCDVSKCIGKFYSQECWCTKPLNPAVDKFFCDSDCTGGLCDVNGLKCKTRESACKPWWWCKLPPPKEPDSFLQTSACSKKESSKRLNERFTQAKKAHSSTSSSLQAASGKMKRQIDAFTFQPGSFVCEGALLPQPDEDPVTLAQFAPGFIVMDGNTCQGGYFKSACFCYDKFLYLRGEDPKVMELQCDSECGLGDCGGKTCGAEPPPPLPAPAPPPVPDPLVQELANAGMLRNYGTQMSPVT